MIKYIEINNEPWPNIEIHSQGCRIDAIIPSRKRVKLWITKEPYFVNVKMGLECDEIGVRSSWIIKRDN